MAVELQEVGDDGTQGLLPTTAHALQGQGPVSVIGELGLDIELTEISEFMRRLDAVRSDSKKAALLTTLLAYDNNDSSKTVEMIRAENGYTTTALYHLGFSWSMTAESYITGFIRLLKSLAFFDVEGESK